ncbi:MAG: ABC transporter ATP-binding protein [Vicinamibacterales bacterium]
MPPPEETPGEDPSVRHLPARELVGRLFPLVRPQWPSFGAGLALLVISVSAELAGPLVLRHIIDVDIATDGRSGILLSAGVYAALFLVGTAANWLQVVVLTRMGLAIITELKETVFRHLLGLSIAYFDHHPPGRLLARVESDSERLQMLFSDVAIALLRTAILLAGALTVMFLTNWRVTLGIVAFAVPIVFGTVQYFRRMRGRYRTVRGMVARISGFISEYVQGVPILQVYGYEDEAARRLAKLNEDKVRTERLTVVLENAFWGTLAAVEVAAITLVLYLGSGQVPGAVMSVGSLILFAEYTRRVFWPLALFSEQLGFIQRAFASADRVFGVLDTPSQTADRPAALATIPPDWRELSFDDVSFVYEGGTRALDHVSFRVRRGETIAIVGLSGGGKSTMASLLMRFYEPTDGCIALDGVDIRVWRQHAWRACIGFVQQDIHLFPGTVADNLRALADDVSQDAVERAARTVGADAVIARLPRGYDEPLNERGSNLSMGERQILSYARALVHDPDLLILDEATSSVDPGTERRLQASMRQMLEGRTAIVIAHRLATVVSASRIVVVHGGRIVEEGTHAALYAQGGVYRDLFDLQFREAATA